MKKPEPIPLIKAAVRLLLQIFSGTMDIPELQRHLATPNVPKFSLALLALGERREKELKVCWNCL